MSTLGEAVQFHLRTLIISLSAPPSSLMGTSTLSQARILLETFLIKNNEAAISESELDLLFKKAEEKEREDEKDHLIWIEFGKKAKDLRTTWANYKAALIDGGESTLFVFLYLSTVY